jgi:hypothetical protein
MATPQPTELEIRSVGHVQETARGNCYVECATNLGVVAFWGKSGNMSNITAIQSRTPPFGVKCGCIPSNWQQHAMWVPEAVAVRSESSS